MTNLIAMYPSLDGCKIVDRAAFPLRVTDVAREHIITLSKKLEQPRLLRVEVTSGGCNGKQYVFNMVEFHAVDAYDEGKGDTILLDGLPLVAIDGLSLSAINGSTLDYTMSIQWTGFMVTDNPLSRSSCNCGSSFA